MKPKPSFVYVTLIATTPEKLWGAITTQKFIRQFWLGRENNSGWKRGDAIESRSPAGELEWDGKVLESKPPRRLVYTFHVAGEKEAASRVTFEIARLGRGPGPQGKAVKLTVTHDRFPPGSKVFPGVTEGWPVILSQLKTLLEKGRSMGLTWKH